jgi:RNA recognition motif-containing protein
VFKEVSSGSKAFKIISCKIVRNSKNQLSRGYGFVEVDSREAAERCIKKL